MERTYITQFHRPMGRPKFAQPFSAAWSSLDFTLQILIKHKKCIRPAISWQFLDLLPFPTVIRMFFTLQWTISLFHLAFWNAFLYMNDFTTLALPNSFPFHSWNTSWLPLSTLSNNEFSCSHFRPFTVNSFYLCPFDSLKTFYSNLLVHIKKKEYIKWRCLNNFFLSWQHGWLNNTS